MIRTFRITAADGKTYDTKHYNLSAIIAVGYKVKRALGADEEPYSRTATIPDDGIAPVSAKNAALLAPRSLPLRERVS